MRKKIDLIILLLVLVAGVFAIKNAQAIGDWWHSVQYHPPADVAKLADDAGMSPEGKKLFYRFSPQLVDAATLGQKCGNEKLGCTEGQSIYMLQFKDDGEYNRTIVTAAHEMLHVAYSRLNPKEVAELDTQLKTELDGYGASVVADQLKGYSSDDYYNEAHSFIGSQLSDISPQLEQHYKRYFDDRHKTATAYRESPER
ncbi:MAG TPA: hypothetical protein VLE73_03300 [Candidatus Saccharimonadales bacterium]|nr:hypothetical protein [Candidatus Saccharimonadales bacterium]